MNKRIQKEEAMRWLLSELNKGIQSAEEHGWISEEEFKQIIFGDCDTLEFLNNSDHIDENAK